MNPFAWFNNVNVGLFYIAASLESLHKKVDSLMATFAEAKQQWVDYATALQQQRDAAVEALNDAQVKAQAAAEALAAYQADDAATDAQQLADQAQAFADELSEALEGIQDSPQEPESLPDEGAHVDNTLPGDLPPTEGEAQGDPIIDNTLPTPEQQQQRLRDSGR